MYLLFKHKVTLRQEEGEERERALLSTGSSPQMSLTARAEPG